jgi:hypothetical protein
MQTKWETTTFTFFFEKLKTPLHKSQSIKFQNTLMIIIIPHSYPRKPVVVSLLQNTQICSWYLPFLQQLVIESQWTSDHCFWAAQQLLQLGSWCNRKFSMTKAPFCVHPSLYCFHYKSSNREKCCNGGSRIFISMLMQLSNYLPVDLLIQYAHEQWKLHHL